MKTIIAGSRSITNRKMVFQLIDELIEKNGLTVSEVVSGGAHGIDRLGEAWATLHNIPIKQFIPDWDNLGKKAGYLRNEQMAEYADQLIAFWDGESRGTKYMIDLMRRANKPNFTVVGVPKEEETK